MREAHVVALPVVEALLALARAVGVGGARGLHHLVVSARAAAQTLGDIVPQLRERASGTRHALALARGRAALTQVRPGGAAVAH